MRFIAFYLPQFHEIEENNEWWGKGFTDWVNVKKAKPLYSGHRQPRIPLNSEYYDLSNIDDIRKQAKLAKEYGIYGFCFYHYWFGGKMLLEKPIELLHKNNDIDLNFCFSWANEPWARTWDGKNNDILITQNYGNESDWERHFMYFLEYFKDDRYIKINNMPMLVIYKSSSIPRFSDMVECWEKLARKNGFDGIYLVDTLRDKKPTKDAQLFNASVEFEPARSLNTISSFELWSARIHREFLGLINKITKKDYLENKVKSFDSVAKKSLKLSENNPSNTFGGLFCGWDNSPRKKTRSTIITEPSDEEFENLVKEKINSVEANNNEDGQYVFINAWNEWAEGTYLEPDTVNGFKYLEILKKYS